MLSMLAGMLTIGALVAAPALAWSQPVTGFYVSGALGMAFPHSPSVTTHSEPELAPTPVQPDPSSSTSLAGHGSVGYGLGNGLRFEVEGNGTNGLRLPHWP
jgi:OmpA-OmpF porin, OOP family